MVVDEQSGLQRNLSIDALRALSVVGVLLFHWFPERFPGGFLGVDIFFVISGYVVTRSCQNHWPVNISKFFSQFYKRRFWRIFPSLFFITAVGLVLVSLFDPLSQPSVRTGVSGLFGAANIEQFLSRDSYFTNQVGVNAFTHFWSLGVEEQFYILYPPLLYTIFRTADNRFSKLLIVLPTGLSFAMYVFLVERGSVNAAFFLLPFRFWEIGTGALVALARRRSRESNDLQQRAFVGIGFMSIGLLFLLPLTHSAFASPLAVAFAGITVLTASRIDQRHSSVMERLAPLGRRAYSLYLVHWVVLVIFRLTIGARGLLIIPVVVVTIILSELNHRFIEIRFMKHDKLSSRSKAAIIVAGLAIATVLPTWWLSKNFLYSGHVRDESVTLNRATCNDEDSQRWLVGDSHADRYANVLGTHFQQDCRQIRDESTRYGFFFDLDGGTRRRVVFADNASFLTDFQRKRPEELWIVNYLQGLFQPRSSVYSSADWVIESYEFPDGSRSSDWRYALEYLMSEYAELLKIARETGTTVMIELPPPDFDWIGQGGLMWRDESSMCEKNWFSPNRSSEFAEVCDVYAHPASVPRAEVERRRAEITSALRGLQSRFPHLRLVDPLTALCSESECSTHRDGVRLFEDDDHYSVAGELLLAGSIPEIVE